MFTVMCDYEEKDPRLCSALIYTQLTQESFLQRLKAAFFYVCGRKSKYGHWEETTLDLNGIKDLRAHLEAYERYIEGLSK